MCIQPFKKKKGKDLMTRELAVWTKEVETFRTQLSSSKQIQAKLEYQLKTTTARLLGCRCQGEKRTGQGDWNGEMTGNSDAAFRSPRAIEMEMAKERIPPRPQSIA
jgi:hypothetical protein